MISHFPAAVSSRIRLAAGPVKPAVRSLDLGPPGGLPAGTPVPARPARREGAAARSRPPDPPADSRGPPPAPSPWAVGGRSRPEPWNWRPGTARAAASTTTRSAPASATRPGTSPGRDHAARPLGAAEGVQPRAGGEHDAGREEEDDHRREGPHAGLRRGTEQDRLADGEGEESESGQAGHRQRRIGRGGRRSFSTGGAPACSPSCAARPRPGGGPGQRGATSARRAAPPRGSTPGSPLVARRQTAAMISRLASLLAEPHGTGFPGLDHHHEDRGHAQRDRVAPLELAIPLTYGRSARSARSRRRSRSRST